MSSSKSFLCGVIAYFIWGVSPIYFKSIENLSATEIIFHRIVWSAVFCIIFIFFFKKNNGLKSFIFHPKYYVILFFTGFLLSGNWLLYVWAINHDYMLEASLGYYINPLLSVLLGTLILKEKMRKLQWLAITLASIGVLIQIILIGELPWISLVLAVSFATYGITRKIVPIGVLTGMAIETWTLLPLAFFWLFFASNPETLTETFWSGSMIWLCILAGPLTLFPLILFNVSAKNLPYSVIGFLQYLSPTLVFLLAIFYFNEPFNSYKLITFGFIWLALCFFSFDIYRNRKSQRN